jgi:hypothetical protein
MPGHRELGEWRVVKQRAWSCPSCGLDRKRTLADMCDVAGVTRMVTLTFAQPIAGAMDWSSLTFTAAPIPRRHRFCDSDTHVYVHADGRYLWRLLPSCQHCCRWVSHRLRLWSLRMRRQWPGFQYLHAREVHKSGALHLHVAVTGIPAGVTRFSKSGRLLKRHWLEVGGGFADVGRHGDNGGRDAGWYVGKYLAKQHDEAFAKGFRRWSRTGHFAPQIRMVPPRDPAADGGWHDPAEPIVLGGWVHPDGVERRWRYWPFAPEGRRLDPRTAKCTQTWPTMLRAALLERREAVSSTPVGETDECTQLELL